MQSPSGQVSTRAAFLSADAILRIARNIAGGLVVNRPIIARNVREYLPYMATENLMMAAVAAGADRQHVHTLVKKHSHAVTALIKEGTGTAAELFDRLKSEPEFASIDFAQTTAPRQFIGRAPEQVTEFLAENVASIQQRYAGRLNEKAELTV